MGLDRNQVIGFMLIGALLIGMFYFNSKGRLVMEAEQLRQKDSIAKLLPKPKLQDTSLVTAAKDTIIKSLSGFQLATSSARNIVLENKVFKISFSEKGGQPASIILKKFNTSAGDQVILQTGKYDKLSYRVSTGNNHTEETSDLLFTAEDVKTGPDGSQRIQFTAADSAGNRIIHSFTIRDNDYLIDFDIELNGKNHLLGRNNINLIWEAEAPMVEKNHEFEKTQTEICFFKEGEYDFEHIASEKEVKLAAPVDWVAVKQQFFAKALIAKNKFSSAPTSWKIPDDTSSNYIVRTTTNASIELAAGDNASVPLQLYFGPSDYNLLKTYNNHLQYIVPYGSDIFSFVKYINRHFLLPVFDFFGRFVSNMGIIILLLTLFIRLITSPILYKSYLSGAKMKALKPELDILRAKFTDPRTKELDQQAFSMEQMKLWRSAGVSPLGGCLPALLQIPIFMSLYYFFQANIDLRGKSFLWAKDLSTFDSILDFSFDIPAYGNHVSLFTLTAVITSLLISIYSMSSMQDNTNPMMKYMPYIFPVILLGVFNRLPAALTWYYTISNIITLLLQIIIQKYIIDHDKIMAQIAENRKKPVKQSKFQERLQAMQESQKKVQELKNKSSKR